MPTLYLMQGPSGSGKTAFLHRWHLDDLVVSPDAMRDMVNPFDHVAGDTAHLYRDKAAYGTGHAAYGTGASSEGAVPKLGDTSAPAGPVAMFGMGLLAVAAALFGRRRDRSTMD